MRVLSKYPEPVGRVLPVSSAFDAFNTVTPVTAPGLSRRYGAKDASGKGNDPHGGRQFQSAV